MEDWTDIIGEELENIEEPLPADDWSVLQQKYAAVSRRKKAAAFAWAGGITSVAAALAIVLLLIRPDSSSVAPDLIDDPNNSVAEILVWKSHGEHGDRLPAKIQAYGSAAIGADAGKDS